MGVIITDIQLTEAGGSSSEIVSVSDVKTYLQIEGTAYDGPISIFITAARQFIEQYCGISLIEKQAVIEAKKAKYCDTIKLPFAPVDEVTKVEHKAYTLGSWEELAEGDEYTVNGEYRKSVHTLYAGLHRVTFSLLPDSRNVFAQAVKAQAAFMFNNRDAKAFSNVQGNMTGAAPEVMALIGPFAYIA